MLPDAGGLSTLNNRFPCREPQIRILSTLIGRSFPSPSNIVVHGLEATGKSSIVKAVLETAGVRHTIVDSRECITGRQLLERTVSHCIDAVQRERSNSLELPRCDSLSALQICLENIFCSQEKFVLVFDGIDKQRDAPPTAIPALSRLGEYILNLTVVFIVSVPSPRLFHRPGIPHIHFPPYNPDESLRILTMYPPPIFLTPINPEIDYTDEEHEEDSAWVWSRFCAAVWDSLGKGAARDLESFRAACHKLWRPFVQPIVDGTFGTRDFPKLLVNRRPLLRGEEALLDGIVSKDTIERDESRSKAKHNLPYYTKFVLCAAYLASFNPPRQDQAFFMKSSEKKKRRRNTTKAAGKLQKHRKIPRNLLAPSPFPLDRLLAILHALLPHPMPQNADIFTQIATLSSLRLLLRAGTAGIDTLDPRCKWRINCGWEYIATLGRSVGLEMRDWVAASQD